ncbi:MAG: TetR family transcriptional regulator [Nocardioides sp.]
MALPLSRERVLDAALQVVDDAGLPGVSMRAVASRLGVEAMSLYHHVASKQALLDGLVDLVVQTAELPTDPAHPEDWLRGTAAALRRLAQEHPRRVALLSIRTLPLADPRSAEPFEAGLRVFVEAGRDVRSAFLALQSASLALLAMAELEAMAAGHDGTDDSASGFASLPPEQFPLLLQVVTENPGPDEVWTTLVDALVRGLDCEGP